MKMLIVGAGSVGGYFGGMLCAAGRDVTFLVRPHRARQLAEGLTLVADGQQRVIAVKLHTPDDSPTGFDLILLAVKAYQLEGAMQDLQPFLGPGTLILPVLNGMKHIDTLRLRFGAASVIGGVAKLATALDEAGRILDRGSFHDLAYGELSGTPGTRLDAVHQFLSGAGFEARLSTDIEREMWEKWAMLAGIGAVTCLMDGTVGEVARVPGGRAIVQHVFAEITAAIEAAWQPLTRSFKAQTLALLTNVTSSQTSSMYRDLKAGHRIEADQIIGDLIDRAAGKGVGTPLLSSLLVRLKVYEGRLASFGG